MLRYAYSVLLTVPLKTMAAELEQPQHQFQWIQSRIFKKIVLQNDLKCWQHSLFVWYITRCISVWVCDCEYIYICPEHGVSFRARRSVFPPKTICSCSLALRLACSVSLYLTQGFAIIFGLSFLKCIHIKYLFCIHSVATFFERLFFQ